MFVIYRLSIVYYHQFYYHTRNWYVFLEKKQTAWYVEYRNIETSLQIPCTPFEKSDGRFISEAKINMMPSSNLHDFWWVYWVHVRAHFPCKIYWHFGLALYPRGSKDGECNFFKNEVWMIVNFMQLDLTDSNKSFQTWDVFLIWPKFNGDWPRYYKTMTG